MKKEGQKHKLEFNKCVLCQKVKNSKGDKKLTSTENGRELLYELSETLQDNLLSEIQEDEKENVKYHVTHVIQSKIHIKIDAASTSF